MFFCGTELSLRFCQTQSNYIQTSSEPYNIIWGSYIVNILLLAKPLESILQYFIVFHEADLSERVCHGGQFGSPPGWWVLTPGSAAYKNFYF